MNRFHRAYAPKCGRNSCEGRNQNNTFTLPICLCPQFSAWVDAVIFVFSLENESSFNAIYNFYTKMSHFRNSSEVPIILVGTQDGISERTPRVIDETRARKLASDLKRCSYYETCATYGLNVERVFQDGMY